MTNCCALQFFAHVEFIRRAVIYLAVENDGQAQYLRLIESIFRTPRLSRAVLCHFAEGASLSLRVSNKIQLEIYSFLRFIDQK